MLKKIKYPKVAKVPTVFQMESTECGAASLAMIMQYYDIYIPLEQLRIDTGVSRDGCRANRILQGARKYGFQAKGMKVPLFRIFTMKPPFIIHWNFNHFLVYEGRRGDKIYVNDPAEGQRVVSLEEFSDSYTGIVLEVKATENCVKTKNHDTVFKLLLKRTLHNKKDILYQLLYGLILMIPSIILPITSQIFIDQVLEVPGEKSVLAARLIIFMIFVIGTRAIFSQYRNWMIDRLQLKMSFISSMKFIKQLLHLPMNFFSQRGAGDLAERIENDNNINEFIGERLTGNIINCIMTILYLGIMIFYSPVLTALFLLMTIVYIIIAAIAAKSLSESIMKVQQDNGMFVSNVYSGINIITTLIATGNESRYISRVLGYYAKYMRSKQKNMKIQYIANAFSERNEAITQTILMIFGGYMVIEGQLTAGELVAYISFVTATMQPLNEMLKMSEDIQVMKADMNRVNDIVHYKTFSKAENQIEEDSMVGKLEGEIEINHISFGYSQLEKPLINDFSCHVPVGKSIAFVGSSGSGKSTISKLASTLYKPWSGEIKFDGISADRISEKVRNSSISIVGQEIMLFSGTIRENITLWNLGIREESVIRAAKDAMIHEEITQKEGAYNYVLEEGGRNISGGQRQRIEIARALVTDPTILIMDEATSALDPITELEIINNIKRRGCTCIIVSHRLSAIRDCDEIVVMQHGKIVQRGNHEELLNTEGMYKTLFAATEENEL